MGKDKKEEQSFQDLWNNIKRFNIPAARVPEGKRDGDRKNHGEIMAENLPNLVKDIKKFTDPVSSKNSKQDKFKKTTQSSCSNTKARDDLETSQRKTALWIQNHKMNDGQKTCLNSFKS